MPKWTSFSCQRQDRRRPELHGAALPILEGISYSPTFGFAELDFSQTDVLAYRKDSGGDVMADWLDSSGKTEPLFATPGRYIWPRLSPDGTRLVLSRTESGDSGVWIYERQQSRMTRVESTA